MSRLAMQGSATSLSMSGRFLLVALTAASVALMLWATTWTWAALLTVRASRTITQWEADPSLYQPHMAFRFHQRLERAVALNPYDANTWFVRARLLELEHEDLLAEKMLQEATAQQATWDLAWARLAQNRSRQRKQDGTLEALQRALILGPYEADTQGIVIPLIFRHWPEVAARPMLRSAAIAVIEHTLVYKPHRELTLACAREHDLLAILPPDAMAWPAQGRPYEEERHRAPPRAEVQQRSNDDVHRD